MKLLKTLKQRRHAARARAKASIVSKSQKQRRKRIADRNYADAMTLRALRDPSTIIGQILRVTDKSCAFYNTVLKYYHYDGSIYDNADDDDFMNRYMNDSLAGLLRYLREMTYLSAYDPYFVVCHEMLLIIKGYIYKFSMLDDYLKSCVDKLDKFCSRVWFHKEPFDYVSSDKNPKFYKDYMNAALSILHLMIMNNADRIAEVFGSYADQYEPSTYAEFLSYSNECFAKIDHHIDIIEKHIAEIHEEIRLSNIKYGGLYE